MYSLFFKKIIVKIPCGGGHRSWDCVIRNKLIQFLYILQKQVFLVTIPLDSLFIPPLLVCIINNVKLPFNNSRILIN
jgi:hypothetical protein